MSISRVKAVSLVPLPGLFLAATAVLILIFATERSGLPVWWTELFVASVLIVALISVIWQARNAIERIFFGRSPLLSNTASGVVLGMLVYGVLRLLPSFHQPRFWLAGVAGVVLGLLFSHVWKSRNHATQSQGISGNAHSGQNAVRQNTNSEYFGVSLLLGLAMLALGGLIACLSLKLFLGDVATGFGVTTRTGIIIALLFALAGVALGGWQGAVAISATLIVLVLAGLMMGLAMGVLAFGALPLPSFSDEQTVQAIVALRKSWLLEHDLYLAAWPSLETLLDPDALLVLAQTTAVSAALSLLLAPSIPVERRSVAFVSVLVALGMPLLLMALGGFAVEAAAKQLVATPVNRPVPELLEAVRLGMLSVCGGFPETAGALRQMCGFSPRDAAFFDLSMVKPLHGFLVGGLPVSLGYATTSGMIIRLIPLALAMMGLVLGLWLMALGLGSHLLGWRHKAAGLASYRIGLMRVSALFAAFALGAAALADIPFSPLWTGTFFGAISSITLCCQLLAHWVSKAAPRQAPQAA